MFICSPCLDARSGTPPLFDIRSYGPCEFCEVTRSCYNIKARDIPLLPEQEVAREVDEDGEPLS